MSPFFVQPARGSAPRAATQLLLVLSSQTTITQLFSAVLNVRLVSRQRRLRAGVRNVDVLDVSLVSISPARASRRASCVLREDTRRH